MDRSRLLIEQLADGEWHSGEVLAEMLGVSRAAVWKRLQALEGLGLELEATRGKGYRLARKLELLSEQNIGAGLRQSLKYVVPVEVFSQIDSTNVYLMSGDVAPAAVFAEYQSAGRGRRGRAWCSPFGANLYFSFAWRFETMPPQLPALSLAVGVSLAETLSAKGAGGLGLKWPNDLLWQGRKLGGILIEHRGEAAGPCRVVVGVGLNLAMTSTQGAAIDQGWVSLEEILRSGGHALPSRNQLATQLIARLHQCLEQFAHSGFDSFHPRWEALDVSRNQVVRIQQEKETIEGVAQGVDRSGALLVQVRGERCRFFSGEISLRVKQSA